MFLSNYIGHKLYFTIHDIDDENIFNFFIQTDEVIGDQIYNEEFRPLIHFTPKKGWINDPNGLIYYNGEYHRFYQHNPYGVSWENMNWGHSVSNDLLHWKELNVSLTPPNYGDHCYSGSAVIDHNNTLGLQKHDKSPMVAIYTSTGRGQCLAISHDNGRTWNEYKNNPVLVHGLISEAVYPKVNINHYSRDPKVFWYEPSKEWVMLVFEELKYYEEALRQDMKFVFYKSKDLVNWTRKSYLDGWYECPDIFELPVDNNENNRKWVIMEADGAYALGKYNGSEFIIEQRRENEFDPYIGAQNRIKVLENEEYKYEGFYGDMYATQTFTNIPESDGRTIFTAWFVCNFEGMPFCNSLSFPLELSLRTTQDGVRLFFEPVKEINTLCSNAKKYNEYDLMNTTTILKDTSRIPMFIKIEIDEDQVDGIELEINGAKISYDRNKMKLRCYIKEDKIVEAPLKPTGNKINLDIIADRQLLEIFGNKGRIYMPVSIDNSVYTSVLILNNQHNKKISKFEVEILKRTVPNNP